MFELNFKDDRYLPFEGAGVISAWSLELLSHPDVDTKSLRQFDYDTIGDVLLHVKYTAKEDAGLFKKKAIEYLKNLLKDATANAVMPLMQLMSVKHEFSHEFYQLQSTPAGVANGSTKLKLNKERFPYLASGFKLKIKKFMLVASFTDGAPATAEILDPDGNPALDGVAVLTLVNTPRFGTRLSYGVKEFDMEVKNDNVTNAKWDWTITMPRARATKLDDLFAVIEYELRP